MTSVARQAGNALLRDFTEIQRLIASVAGTGKISRRALYRTEKLIQAELTSAREKYGIVSDLSEEVAGSDTSRRWLFSSISGFENFQNGIPHWAVAIALEDRGTCKIAVIYDPYKNEMFRAEKGRGAYMNNIRLRATPRTGVDEFIVAIGRSLPSAGIDIGVLELMVGSLRSTGVPSLDLVYLAAGRLHGYLGCSKSDIDQIAGQTILTESGVLTGTSDSLPAAHDVYFAAGTNGFDNFAAVVDKAIKPRPDHHQ